MARLKRKKKISKKNVSSYTLIVITTISSRKEQGTRYLRIFEKSPSSSRRRRVEVGRVTRANTQILCSRCRNIIVPKGVCESTHQPVEEIRFFVSLLARARPFHSPPRRSPLRPRPPPLALWPVGSQTDNGRPEWFSVQACLALSLRRYPACVARIIETRAACIGSRRKLVKKRKEENLSRLRISP